MLCGTEAETGFVPTSAQFIAVSTFSILRSPSWTRSCIPKYPRCVSFDVLLPIDPSKNSPSNCPFVFQPSLEIPETGSLPTKTVILSTCFCLRNLSAALGFPSRYRAARFNGRKSNSRGSLSLWAKCFAVSARSNLSWVKYESLMKADLYRVASPFFRIGLRLPSNTSLFCSFSRDVYTA